MDLSVSRWVQLSTHTYWCQVQPLGTNVGLVVSDSKALLIDTGHHPSQGSQLCLSAEEETNKEIVGAVITHAHYDHIFGVPGISAPIWAHENYRLDLETCETSQAAKDFKVNLETISCAKTFSLAEAISLEKLHIELIHLDHGHSASDVAILVPEDNIIFCGDLLESANDPQIGQTTRLNTWPKAIDGFLASVNEHTKIVPGHGPIMDDLAAINQRNQIEALWNQSEWLFKNGVELETALAQINQDLAEEFWPPFTSETIAKALRSCYQLLGAQGVKPIKYLPLVNP